MKEREGKREEGGRNGFDETPRDYKAKYKGTGSPKPQQIRKNDTKSPKQSCRHIIFCIFGYRGAGEGVHRVQRTKLKNVVFFWTIFLLIVVTSE